MPGTQKFAITTTAPLWLQILEVLQMALPELFVDFIKNLRTGNFEEHFQMTRTCSMSEVYLGMVSKFRL